MVQTKLMYGFILCWLIALLDSVRLGLKQDKQDAAPNNALSHPLSTLR